MADRLKFVKSAVLRTLNYIKILIQVAPRNKTKTIPFLYEQIYFILPSPTCNRLKLSLNFRRCNQNVVGTYSCTI